MDNTFWLMLPQIIVTVSCIVILLLTRILKTKYRDVIYVATIFLISYVWNGFVYERLTMFPALHSNMNYKLIAIAVFNSIYAILLLIGYYILKQVFKTKKKVPGQC